MLHTRPHLTRIATIAALVTLGAAVPAARAASGSLAGEATRVSLVLPAQADCQVAGPYATMRRANEVAAEARRRGYSAVAYHNGDGYYVRAC